MADTKNLTSIVIVNYNSGNLILDCIESILKTKNNDIEIIVVDNASTDGSHKKCKEKFPQIKLIENKENFGYCEGCNIGVRQAKGNFIVTANADTKAEPNWLDELLKAYNKFGDALYQPKIPFLNDPHIISSGGNMIHIFGFGYARGQGSVDKGQFDKMEEVTCACGTFLFTTANVLKKIGYFDPFIFAYHDDTDPSWRAAQLGIKSYYVPSCLVYHYGSYNFKWSPLKFFLLERNRHYCLLTHYSRKTLYKMLPSLIIVEILVIFYYLYKGFVTQKFKGYANIIKNRKHISKKYQEIESKKIVSDEELIKTFPDDIFFPEEIGGKLSSKILNLIISKLSKMTKRFIGI